MTILFGSTAPEPSMLSFLKHYRDYKSTHSSNAYRLTLNAFFDEHYFPHAKVSKRLSHHDWSIYNTHIRAKMGHYLLEDVTNPALDVWVREQQVHGYQRSTINKHIYFMNRMLNLARHWGHISGQNPYQQNIKRLSIGDYTQRFLTEAEIERLIKACRANRHPFLLLFVQLLLLTGARKGEARLARWRDFDFNKRVWTVPRSKNGRSRRIILSAAAVAVLQDTRMRSEEMMLPTTQDRHVFTNPRTLTAYHSFYAAWFIARDLAELEDLRIHDLRHTYASILINSGVSLYEVQTLLGHSSLQMTQRYAHLEPNLLHQRTELMSTVVTRNSI